MKAQGLKNSMLQLAVQGKLVEQNPDDEPAAVLLEKIKAEKARLVKEKKIKANKTESSIFKGEDGLFYEDVGGDVRCIDEEIPFEIPESWAWCRLSSIVYNFGQKKPDKDFVYIDVGSIDNKNGKLGGIETVLHPNEAPSRARKIVKKGTVIYSTVRPYLLNICIVDKDFENEPICSTAFAVLNPYNGISNVYLYFTLRSPMFVSYVSSQMIGVAYPAINDETLNLGLVSIPPIAEQQRIVAKINELQPMIDAYDKAERELTNLNNRFPDDLKKSVLQYAVQGKLVEQNPEDEPAAVLLKKIKAEKARLVKEKKIKADKVSSSIYKGEDGSYYENVGGEIKCIDEEIPFEIPESWAWVRLGDALQVNPRNNISDNLDVAFIPMTLISDGYNNTHRAEVRKWKDVKTGFTHFAEGDIGFAKITPCFENRKSVIFQNLENGFGAGTTELHILRPLANTVNPLYVLWFVKNPMFIDNGTKTYKGTAGQQRIGRDYVEGCLFPLPPYEEQQRIVEKVEEFLRLCDRLN